MVHLRNVWVAGQIRKHLNHFVRVAECSDAGDAQLPFTFRVAVPCRGRVFSPFALLLC